LTTARGDSANVSRFFFFQAEDGIRDHGPEAEPHAAHGARAPSLLPVAPPLRHGEVGPGSRGDRRARPRARREGQAARRPERRLVFRTFLTALFTRQYAHRPFVPASS